MPDIYFSAKQLKSLIQKMQKLRILVLGDLMLDEFVWGKVSRISPEAPVPIVHVTQETLFPGGAANVARNLADFGIGVGICGVLGRDPAGDRLTRLMKKARMDTKGLYVNKKFSTIVKTRIIARQQQVVRVDRETPLRFGPAEVEKVKSYLRREQPKYDAVIVEDYGKGFLTQEIYDEVVRIGSRKKQIIAVDPNPNNHLNFTGATVVKPNRSEACALCGTKDTEDEEQVDRGGRQLLERWKLPYLLVTMGEHGMKLYQPGRSAHHTPTRAREVFDVSGAGDTVISFFTAALAAGLSGNEASEIANHAAGVVVSKLGTATLQPAELIQGVLQDEKPGCVS